MIRKGSKKPARGARHVKPYTAAVYRPGDAPTKTPRTKCSENEPKGGFLDPLSVLQQMHPYPISFLALCAAHGGLLSGSQAVPDGSTRDSDFDMYYPFAPPAIHDIMHVLNFGKIQWDNVLSDRLKEVARCGSTIVPFKLILSLVEALSSVKPCPLDHLLDYLQVRFEDVDLDSNSVNDFLSRFDHAVQNCRMRMKPKSMWYGLKESREMVLRQIWVYQGVRTRVYLVPPAIMDTISRFRDILYECHPYYVEENARHGEYVVALSKVLFDYEDKHDGDEDHDEDDDENDDGEENILTPVTQSSDPETFFEHDQAPRKDVIGRILEGWKRNGFRYPLEPGLKMEGVRKLWKKEGLDDDQMRGYIIDKLSQEIPFCSRSEIDLVVDRVLHPHRRACPNPLRSDVYHGLGFRILGGVLPDRKKIQVIFIPPKSTGIRTILSFYATHVMCFIGGTLGAYLNWPTAKRRVGETFNFRHDVRQKKAEQSIMKWKERSWSFNEISGNMVLRRAEDEKVKMVDYEGIYKAALEQVHGGDRGLPRWWKAFFNERKHAFCTYNWTQANRRIFGVHNSRTPLGDSEHFLEWIHTNLDGHPQVIPRKQWNERDEARVHLDLWFGGININPNWDNQPYPTHESWADGSWHNVSWLRGSWDIRYSLF
jgi:hypothetical protein